MMLHILFPPKHELCKKKKRAVPRKLTILTFTFVFKNVTFWSLQMEYIILCLLLLFVSNCMDNAMLYFSFVTFSALNAKQKLGCEVLCWSYTVMIYPTITFCCLINPISLISAAYWRPEDCISFLFGYFFYRVLL